MKHRIRKTIGWRWKCGKLVEYRDPNMGFPYCADVITLAESIEWLKKMEFASERFGWVSQVAGPFRIKLSPRNAVDRFQRSASEVVSMI